MVTIAALATGDALVASRDTRSLDARLAENVVFHSPSCTRRRSARPSRRKYLAAAFHVFFTRPSGTSGVVGPFDAVLEFQVEIDGSTVNGVDMLTWDDAGRIVDFKVMIRPIKASISSIERWADMLQAGNRLAGLGVSNGASVPGRRSGVRTPFRAGLENAPFVAAVRELPVPQTATQYARRLNADTASGPRSRRSSISQGEPVLVTIRREQSPARRVSVADHVRGRRRATRNCGRVHLGIFGRRPCAHLNRIARRFHGAFGTMAWLAAWYLPATWHRSPVPHDRRYRRRDWPRAESHAQARFQACRTTTNPRDHRVDSSLVTSGIYRHTRNPMYLGSRRVLLGWAIYLQHWSRFLRYPTSCSTSGVNRSGQRSRLVCSLPPPTPAMLADTTGC